MGPQLWERLPMSGRWAQGRSYYGKDDTFPQTAHSERMTGPFLLIYSTVQMPGPSPGPVEGGAY